MGKSLENLKILLIDDDLLTLDAYRLFLSMEGANIQAVGSTGEAFKILQDWIPDVIVSDIGLPGEDGYSFMTKVRARPDLQTAFAIAITGYSNTTKAKGAGFQEVLAKPLDPTELLTLLQTIRSRPPETS